jgi:hypothetical protein
LNILRLELQLPQQYVRQATAEKETSRERSEDAQDHEGNERRSDL